MCATSSKASGIVDEKRVFVAQCAASEVENLRVRGAMHAGRACKEVVMSDVFDNATKPEVTDAVRETDWKALHAMLRELARQRVALEAREADYLVEADDMHLYRRLGYSTMAEYMERELHYSPHAANERLRVARELAALPMIAELFRGGELSFSSVRELTRVATPETEEDWLAKAHGKTARDVERMVAGLRRGDRPDATPDPALVTTRIVLEVPVEVAARYRRQRTELDKARGERVSDGEALECWLRAAEGEPIDEVTPPAVQIAVTTCRACKQRFLSTDGMMQPLRTTTAELLGCDATEIGDLDSNEHTRPSPRSRLPFAGRCFIAMATPVSCLGVERSETSTCITSSFDVTVASTWWSSAASCAAGITASFTTVAC
jgi:hypothetical protein